MVKVVTSEIIIWQSYVYYYTQEISKLKAM